MRTQVAIIARRPLGPAAGQAACTGPGVDAVIIERQSSDYVLGRIRAWVPGQVTIDLLDEAGVGSRMHREGLVHGGFELLFKGARHRIDMQSLTGGRQVMVYGQTEVTRDLMAARAGAGLRTVYEASEVSVHDFDGERPRVRYTSQGQQHELSCDFIAGCDGFHGVCRASVPPGAITEYEKVYPFGWLGVLADVPPVLARADLRQHGRAALRCARCAAPPRSRYYVQVPGERSR